MGKLIKKVTVKACTLAGSITRKTKDTVVQSPQTVGRIASAIKRDFLKGYNTK